MVWLKVWLMLLLEVFGDTWVTVKARTHQISRCYKQWHKCQHCVSVSSQKRTCVHDVIDHSILKSISILIASQLLQWAAGCYSWKPWAPMHHSELCSVRCIWPKSLRIGDADLATNSCTSLDRASQGPRIKPSLSNIANDGCLQILYITLSLVNCSRYRCTDVVISVLVQSSRCRISLGSARQLEAHATHFI